jgi:hypothetical protein
MLVYTDAKPINAYQGLFDWLFGGNKPKAKQEQTEEQQEQKQKQQGGFHLNLNTVLLIGGGLLVAYFLFKGGQAEHELKKAKA